MLFLSVINSTECIEVEKNINADRNERHLEFYTFQRPYVNIAGMNNLINRVFQSLKFKKLKKKLSTIFRIKISMMQWTP